MVTNLMEQIENNWFILNKQDRQAKEKGKLVGRYISEPVADGQAIYEIVKENKKTVKIVVFENGGDDYRVSYWGDVATIEKKYAEFNLRCRDCEERLFAPLLE